MPATYVIRYNRPTGHRYFSRAFVSGIPKTTEYLLRARRFSAQAAVRTAAETGGEVYTVTESGEVVPADPAALAMPSVPESKPVTLTREELLTLMEAVADAVTDSMKNMNFTRMGNKGINERERKAFNVALRSIGARVLTVEEYTAKFIKGK